MRHEAASRARAASYIGQLIDAGLARRLVRIAPAEQQPALLEPPVQPRADVEHHRHPLDVEGRVWLEDRDRVARGAGRDPERRPPGRRRGATARRSAGRARSSIGPGARLDADHAPAAARRRYETEARGTPSARAARRPPPASRASRHGRCAAGRCGRRWRGSCRRGGRRAESVGTSARGLGRRSANGRRGPRPAASRPARGRPARRPR